MQASAFERAAALKLQVLVEAVRALQESVDHLMRRQLAPEDRRTGAALWPLVADLLGDRPFTGPALYADAMNDRSAIGQAVRALIVDQGEADCGLRAFGKLLARLEGVPLAGYRLVSAGQHRLGRAWRLVQVSGAGNLQP